MRGVGKAVAVVTGAATTTVAATVAATVASVAVAAAQREQWWHLLSPHELVPFHLDEPGTVLVADQCGCVSTRYGMREHTRTMHIYVCTYLSLVGS